MSPYRPLQAKTTTRAYLGPIYTLDDGTRLRDLTAHCRYCGKRLAELHHDPTGTYPGGCLLCLDCGRTTR